MSLKTALLLITTFFSLSIYAQDSTDALRLKQMSYMKYSSKVNCDSMEGSSLEERICLNLSFQKTDSLLNNLLKTIVLKHQNDSLWTDSFRTIQELWVTQRRRKSEKLSKGFQGHALGIIYLNSMIRATEERILLLTKKE